MKKKLYPKTERVSIANEEVVITEKLDGSNLGLFKFNGELIIALRNNVLKFSEIEESKDIMYKGLYAWLKENGKQLVDCLHEESGVFGEWLGMGKIKYPDLENRYYIFAKARINKNLDIYKLNYDLELIHYAFVDGIVPKDLLDTVTEVSRAIEYPIIEELDTLYDHYKLTVDRDVEGFVLNYKNSVKKYVRMKNGKLENHKF